MCPPYANNVKQRENGIYTHKLNIQYTNTQHTNTQGRTHKSIGRTHKSKGGHIGPPLRTKNMDKDKNFGHRKSIRLHGYDYSSVEFCKVSSLRNGIGRYGLRQLSKRSRNVSATQSVDIKNKGLMECCRSCCSCV